MARLALAVGTAVASAFVEVVVGASVEICASMAAQKNWGSIVIV